MTGDRSLCCLTVICSVQAEEEARRNRLMRDMAQLRLQVGDLTSLLETLSHILVEFWVLTAQKVLIHFL